ncbi:MAG TPA: hypothetical protein VN461_11535 [Vicinamibacteria bacterium]|nr:hypothetical protein [Vicinamibacteria bacterium]
MNGGGRARSLAALLLIALANFVGCNRAPEPGQVLDEARLANRPAESFPAADEDYFRHMDGDVVLTSDEIKGRNTWLVWTGGNDRFWDAISKKSVGTLDFLKTVSSHPKLKFSRDNRWNYLGLVNEPCFEKAKGPDPQRFGLWLDKRSDPCPADPFENEKKYPGVALGARGKNLPVGSYYGYGTGIVGLRLFPNPAFDQAAAQKWDPVRYYEDPSYYLSKNLVKPYRVGMACAFCHVGPNPVHPPRNPESPEWADLSSNVGAQYFWIDRIFSWEADPSSFPYQLFHTSRPGALDTSLVSTDYINNPRTMNAVYSLKARLEHSKRWGKETLAGGGLHNAQFNDYVKTGPLTEFFQRPDTVWTPRVLKDGSDSVGALGALNRVYLNIGLFSEEWLLHFNALVGGKPTTRIEIAVARKNSAYWLATEAQTPNLALFFLNSTEPHRLKDGLRFLQSNAPEQLKQIPGGLDYLPTEMPRFARGKQVFAERCARCHSSKLPSPAIGLDPDGCNGAQYLGCWNRYWDWTKTDDFKRQMGQIVQAKDFLENNFLSSEFRVPVTLLQTNACSTLATNAIAGSIWDNFSSQSYKELPSVGEITVHHPYTGEPWTYKMPAGGRGYTRPASLVSLWSTAPFLLNNSVGLFDPSPSVDARLRSFQDSIEKMLWPEKRDKDDLLGDKVPGRIDRTTATSYLRVPAGFLPSALQPLLGWGSRWLPAVFGESGIEIGPIPKGTPVNLLANLELVSASDDAGTSLVHGKQVVDLLGKVKHDLEALPANATDEQARQVFANLVGKLKDGQPEPGTLLALSKCPDFVVNRGHYFGTDRFAEEPGLRDDDKRALIEFLKTF